MKNPPADVRQRLDRIKAARTHAASLQTLVMSLMETEGQRARLAPVGPKLTVFGEVLWLGTMHLLSLENELLNLSNSIRSEHKMPAVRPSRRMEMMEQVVQECMQEAEKELQARKEAAAESA